MASAACCTLQGMHTPPRRTDEAYQSDLTKATEELIIFEHLEIARQSYGL
jgi:hypothetical protein